MNLRTQRSISKINKRFKFNIDDSQHFSILGPLGQDNSFVYASVYNRASLKSSPILSSMSSIINMVQGVCFGYSKQLFLRGIGFRSLLHQDKNILLDLGYTHYYSIFVPNHIKVISKRNRLLLFSASIQELEDFSNKILRLRFPDPYKGKGISLFEEQKVRKVGKKR